MEVFADKAETLDRLCGAIEQNLVDLQRQRKSEYEEALGKFPRPVELSRVFGQRVGVARAKVIEATYYCGGRRRVMWSIQPLAGEEVLPWKIRVEYEKKPSTGWFGLRC